MATAKNTAKTTPAKKAVKPAAAKAPAKAAPARKAASAPATAELRPVKETFTKSSLTAHLAAQSGVEPKSVKAVMAALEATMLGAMHKRGVGEFTLPGLLKIGVQKVPAKKKRIGKDPFTGVEREFAAKPATVRIKPRAMKKLKDAAL